MENKLWYKIEYQFADGVVIDESVRSQFEEAFGAVYDMDDHSFTLLFESDVSPSAMQERLLICISENPCLAYIDAVYIYEGEMIPDRVVCWANGMVQHYTGHVYFIEDGE